MSLIWELQELKRKTNKSYSLAACVDAARTLEDIWNDGTEMTHNQTENKESIWNFNNKLTRQSFYKKLKYIQVRIESTEDL